MKLLAAAALATACQAARPARPSEPARVRVRSFTEAAPVHHILAVPPFAFAATGAGLDRWDLRSGVALHIGAEHGLPGERVQALDYDAAGEVWIATDGGLVRYNVQEDAFHEVAPPPAVLGVDSFEGATVSAAPNGAWIGLGQGLFHVTREGDWSPTAVAASVTALHGDPGSGLLWIGTATGLFVSRAGATAALGPGLGCDLSSVRFIARGPDGAIVVVGEGGAGEQRIALAHESGCHTYRVSPDEDWVAAASRPDELLIMTDRRLYSLRRPVGLAGRALARDGMQLLPVPRGDGSRPAPSPFVMQAMPGQLPAGAQALAAFGDEVLVGTRSLGTARVSSGQRALQWLRRGDLVGQATSLSVACAARDDCYVATGSRRAWRFDGERFSLTGGGERRVLAVARDPDGRIAGLRQTGDGDAIELDEIVSGQWRSTGIAIECPGRDPEVRFARFSPAGLLWLGLRCRDAGGALRPYGVAVVQLQTGSVTYHHTSLPDESVLIQTEPGILPLPMDVAAAAFADDGTAWLATALGAIEVTDDRMTLYGDTSAGARPLAVARSADGLVYIAGAEGVATFDGSTWRSPRELGFAATDVEIGPDDHLWIATERGLAVYDGVQVRRFDARRGLVENRIEDLAVDQFGRVWLRGPQSLEIVF